MALKVPHRQAAQDAEVRGRFVREARALAQFHHPNFCPIFDVGEVDGIPYLAMRYIEGRTLSVGRPRDQREAAEVTRQLAVALAALHGKGIIHRDLKPANVMVEAGGNLVLMDFGLARRFEGSGDPTITRANAILGTPSYMSPEQARGQAVDHRSDVYSLGVILYQLLTGRLPFMGNDSLGVMVQIVTEDPEPPSTHRSGLDPRLEAVCRKAMAKKPDDRYASMDEFARCLAIPAPSSARFEDPVSRVFAEVVTGEPTSLRDGRPPVKPPEDSKGRAIRPPAWIGVAIAALLFGILIIYMMATDKERARIEPQPPSEGPTSPPRVADLFLTNKLGIKLKLIPAGVFDMGADHVDDDAKPVHRVRITRPLYLGVTEVTQGQYRAVTGASPSHFQGPDDLPVEHVSWLDAVRFCNALSLKEGLTPFYRVEGDEVSVSNRMGPGYRLPTETEWEYAARAGPGGTGAYSFGDDATQLSRYAWFEGNSENKTHPVGGKQANAWGLFDMHGNVWEWCEDCFDSGYYSRSPQADPLNSIKGGSDRVFRGGSWDIPAEYCSAACRNGITPSFTDYNLGFRVARGRSGP